MARGGPTSASRGGRRDEPRRKKPKQSGGGVINIGSLNRKVKPISFYVGAAFLVSFSSVVLQTVNNTQSVPYLDEVFHVPQTQRFCNGSFNEWDPKITTLPGTYIMAAGSIKTLEYFGLVTYDVANPCSTSNLRLFNFVVGVQNFLLIKDILEYHMTGENEWKIMLSAVNISMFPVLYFFNFLYYTDVTSTFWMLLMHTLFLRRRFFTSAVCGGLAILTRQTNVVWVAWHAILIGFNCLKNALIEGEEGSGKCQDKKNRKNGSKQDPETIVEYLQILARSILKHVLKDLQSLAGYFVCIWLFVMFVIWNGGIVVGDKTAHIASLNVPQLGYFTLVFGLFCAPFIGLRLRPTIEYLLGRKPWVALAVVLCVAAVHFNTVAHPYLLADNRHYPFYLWKRVFQAYPWARYALIPNYILVWAFIFNNSPKNTLNNYAFAFLLCTAAQLIPQLLLEFRYFIPIYLLARVVIPKPSWLELICEFVINVGVNIVTLRLFLYNSFYWSDVDEAQRFMW